MTKNITLKNCDKERVKILTVQLNKFRCYMSGFIQGSQMEEPVGYDSLRQIELILKNSLGE